MDSYNNITLGPKYLIPIQLINAFGRMTRYGKQSQIEWDFTGWNAGPG